MAFLGRSWESLGLPEAVDDSFQLKAEDTVESVLVSYRVARADAERIHAGMTLDELALHNRRSPMNLRWVLLHLIGELAQHVGHGEILREQLLTA